MLMATCLRGVAEKIIQFSHRISQNDLKGKLVAFTKFCREHDQVKVSILVNALNNKEISEAEILINNITEKVKSAAFKMSTVATKGVIPERSIKMYINPEKKQLKEYEASKMIVQLKNQLKTYPGLVLKESNGEMKSFIESTFSSIIKNKEEKKEVEIIYTSRDIITEIKLQSMKQAKPKKAVEDPKLIFKEIPVDLNMFKQKDYFYKLAAKRLMARKVEGLSYRLLLDYAESAIPLKHVTDSELEYVKSVDPLAYHSICLTLSMLNEECDMLKVYAFNAIKTTFKTKAEFWKLLDLINEKLEKIKTENRQHQAQNIYEKSKEILKTPVLPSILTETYQIPSHADSAKDGRKMFKSNSKNNKNYIENTQSLGITEIEEANVEANDYDG